MKNTNTAVVVIVIVLVVIIGALVYRKSNADSAAMMKGDAMMSDTSASGAMMTH